MLQYDALVPFQFYNTTRETANIPKSKISWTPFVAYCFLFPYNICIYIHRTNTVCVVCNMIFIGKTPVLWYLIDYPIASIQHWFIICAVLFYDYSRRIQHHGPTWYIQMQIFRFHSRRRPQHLLLHWLWWKIPNEWKKKKEKPERKTWTKKKIECGWARWKSHH